MLNILSHFDCPSEACQKMVSVCADRWVTACNGSCDDITMIAAFVKKKGDLSLEEQSRHAVRCADSFAKDRICKPDHNSVPIIEDTS